MALVGSYSCKTVDRDTLWPNNTCREARNMSRECDTQVQYTSTKGGVRRSKVLPRRQKSCPELARCRRRRISRNPKQPKETDAYPSEPPRALHLTNIAHHAETHPAQCSGQAQCRPPHAENGRAPRKRPRLVPPSGSPAHPQIQPRPH